MTAANDQVPEPPRHCKEDMDLVTLPSTTCEPIARLEPLSHPQVVDKAGESHRHVTSRPPLATPPVEPEASGGRAGAPPAVGVGR